MTATVVNLRTGDRDAADIGKLCERAKGSMSESLKYLIEAGQRLINKKEELRKSDGHGSWLPWLKANADALGFSSEQTARKMMAAAKSNRALTRDFTESEASQISKSIWGNTKPKRKVKPRKAEAHREVIAERHGRGETSVKINAELGIGSDRAVRHEIKDVEREKEITLKVLEKLGVDPETLAPSAKAKLEASKRMMERQLNAEHAARLRAVDEEVRSRVVEQNKPYVAMLEEAEAKARDEQRLWREIIDNHKAIFSPDEFRTILMCLHPDGERTPDKLNEAFLLFNNRKTQLTGKR